MKNKLSHREKGFSAIEAVMVLIIVVLIGAVGFLVYKNQHKSVAATQSSASSQPSTESKTAAKETQKYLTISAWGVRVPYSGSDTLTVNDQTCTQNGDANGDTVNLGCQVTINSQNLANAVGSCTAKVSGTVGYFYKLGPNDNYGYKNGRGYLPVADWSAQNSGQYSKIGANYYAFAEIGKASGVSGAAVADSNDMNGTYTGCSDWQTEYKSVSQSVQALAPKFETVTN
jgi:Tfp pilus assembly protein PilX